MTEESRKTIERNVISNRVFAKRLKGLLLRHCVNRNLRQYGRTAELVREWLVEYPYDTMDVASAIGFLTRRDILNWATAMMAWPGWEAFLDRIVSAPDVTEIVKAYFLYLGFALHGVPERANHMGKRAAPQWMWSHGGAREDEDPQFHQFLDQHRSESDARLLMLFDLHGLEWTWDRVEGVDYECRDSLIEKLFEIKMDDLCACAAAETVVEFSLVYGQQKNSRMADYMRAIPHWRKSFVECEEDVAADVKARLRLISSISARYPDAYGAYYRKHQDLFVRIW